MKKIFFIAALCITNMVQAQITQPANGGSVRGWTGEQVGITDITINYGRPALRGRQGKVWGQVVPNGFEDDASFGRKRKIPWRAGANESTYMTFSTDVTIEGKKLAAGKYGFFIAYGDDACTLIFSRNAGGWGSYMYDEADDVLRVTVKPVSTTETTERLTYSFSNQTDSSAVINLAWENKKIPFTVSTELQKLQLATIKQAVNSEKALHTETYVDAAVYLFDNNIMLDDALEYINTAARSMPNFYVMSTKAGIQRKLGKTEESKQTLVAAIKAASNPNQPYFYARRMLEQDMKQDAFDAFKLNYELHPDVFITNVGMARGYAAMGNTKNALKHANKALAQAPNEANKKSIEQLIETIKNSNNAKS